METDGMSRDFTQELKITTTSEVETLKYCLLIGVFHQSRVFQHVSTQTNQPTNPP